MKYLTNFYFMIRALARSGRLGRDEELRLHTHVKQLRHSFDVRDIKRVKRQVEALCDDLIDALR